MKHIPIFMKTTKHAISSIIVLITLFLGITAKAEKPLVVKPLIKSRWHQHTPYNEASPFGSRWGKTPPGCGAVAAGQILNLHRTLKKAYGIKAYYSLNNKNMGDSMLILKNFDQHKFDWGNIRNNYMFYKHKPDYTERQAKAVADYLSQIGIAMHTHYNDGGSSSVTNGSTLWGLHHHLHLSPKAVVRHRQNYSTEEWKALINEQLKAGKPVYYAATQNYIGNNGKQVRKGHAFIIDGINKDGKYHANYGHGGNNDKYVDLNIINYYDYEFPGNRHTCYENSQRMITDFYQTESDTIYPKRSVMIEAPIVINDNQYKNEWIIPKGNRFYFRTEIENYNILREDIQYTLGVFKDNELYTILEINAAELPRVGRRAISTLFTMPEELEDGEYELRLLTRSQAHPRWVKSIECLPVTMKLNVDKERTTRTLPPSRTLPSRLYLREPISEVNVPETKGKSFKLALKNPSDNNFDSHFIIEITVGEEVHSFRLGASVYSNSEVDYHISIPQSALNLDKTDYKIVAKYYEHNNRTYQNLGLTEPPIHELRLK